MVKSELTNRIAEHFDDSLSHRDIETGINALLDRMSHSLADNERIEIRGFGSFNLHYRAPRNAHNPKTGEKVYTKAKYTPHFKPGKELRERVDQSREQYAIKDTESDEEDEE